MAFRQMQTSQRVKAIVRPHKMSVRLSLYTRHRINTAIPNFNFKLIYLGNIHSIVYIKTFLHTVVILQIMHKNFVNVEIS